MTQAVKGKTHAEAEEIFERFHQLVTTQIGQEPQIENLGKLAVFSGVREYPMRVKCATLACIHYVPHSTITAKQR